MAVKKKKPAFTGHIGSPGITYQGAPIQSGLTGSTSQQAAQAAGGPNAHWQDVLGRKPQAAPAAPSAPATAPAAPASTPNAPIDPFSVSSYNPASGAPDPRDATYFANLAKLQATSHQDYAAGQLEQTNADVNFNTQLGTMATDRQRNIRNLAESMIGKGLLRSGYHDRGQTEGAQDYLTAVTDAQTSKSQSDAQRQATMAAILQNLGIDEQGLYADTAGRYAQSQQDLADRQAAANAAAIAAAAGAPGGAAAAPPATGAHGAITSGHIGPLPVKKPPKKK